MPRPANRLRGLVTAMREMAVGGDPIAIPYEKRGSAYQCAKSAGIRVSVTSKRKRNGEMVAYVWRVE